MPETYRFILPHLQYVGRIFFQTFRLEGSIPKTILNELKTENEAAIAAIKRKKISESSKKIEIQQQQSLYFQKLDDYLDKIEAGPHYLKQPEIAFSVIEKLKEFDGKYYRMEAYCIMSNHVHVLLDFSIQLQEDGKEPYDYVQLDAVMQLIKGGSSRACNLILGKQGSFWARSNFDRYIRNERHYNNVINYIINNPVKAGICNYWSDYPYTYLRPLEY